MLKEFSFKQFGQLNLAEKQLSDSGFSAIAPHIKILFLPKHTPVIIDFQHYDLDTDSLLFINPHVVLHVHTGETGGAQLLHFNRDFYCIEIHDQEVACDGILYNNVFEIPFIRLNAEQSAYMQQVLAEITAEMAHDDSGTEEMIRILLKLIILKSTRIWKSQHQLSETAQQADVQFLRRFSQLVEQHYKTRHTVAEYADLLFLTPKNLSKKIGLISNETPNDIIKNRIILESKRLLAHTQMTVKEIAYSLNYEDDAYFVRFFTKHTGLSPTAFRKQF